MNYIEGIKFRLHDGVYMT